MCAKAFFGPYGFISGQICLIFAMYIIEACKNLTEIDFLFFSIAPNMFVPLYLEKYETDFQTVFSDVFGLDQKKT